jgi:hypothetical protein
MRPLFSSPFLLIVKKQSGEEGGFMDKLKGVFGN